MKKLIITYQVIAELLETTEENIRQQNHRGEFDIDNIESTILFIAANIMLRDIATKQNSPH